MGHFLHNHHNNKEQRRSFGRSRNASTTSTTRQTQNRYLTAEAVAALPPPGLSGPSNPVFSPKQQQHSNATTTTTTSSRYLAFLSSNSMPCTRRPSQFQFANGTTTATTGERQLCVLDLNQLPSSENVMNLVLPLLKLSPIVRKSNNNNNSISLEEQMRRERQRLVSSGGATQFSWIWFCGELRILVPQRGNLYIQDGGSSSHLECVYNRNLLQERLFGKTETKTSGPVIGRDASAIDAQLSPDGTMVAFVVAGDVYVLGIANNQDDDDKTKKKNRREPIRVTHCPNDATTHGLADFVAQEEMDRYRGYWWNPDSSGILFTRVDETRVPPYRITHQGRDGSCEDAPYEDHRYPFAGKENPSVQLGYVVIDRATVLNEDDDDDDDVMMSVSQNEQDDGDSDEDMKVLNYFLDEQPPLQQQEEQDGDNDMDTLSCSTAQLVARDNWTRTVWLDPPREAREYLARVSWLPDGSACAQWQNRSQSTLAVVRMDLSTSKTRTLLVERSDVWINLHHMMQVLPRAIHPDECWPVVENHDLPNPLPQGSFSFLFASERSGYTHLYLYTYAPGCNGERAVQIRTVSGGDWIVESIVGVDMENDAVYITGTYSSPLERHLYALPITNNKVRTGETDEFYYGDASENGGKLSDSSGGVRRSLKHVMSALSGKPSSFRKSNSQSSMESSSTDSILIPDPVRLTTEPGMHNIVMDEDCTTFVDTSSDLDRPTSVKLYTLPETGPFGTPYVNGSTSTRGKKASRKQVDAHDSRNGSGARLLCVLYDASRDEKAMPMLSSLAPDISGTEWLSNLAPPELLSFPTSDGTETLHAAVYKPDPAVHGPGPYPLVCAVYGGPHVQRVNKSWSQSADMRAQMLRSLGFAVVKCDNRGSSRRGLAFESAIRRRLGRLEVLDQVTTVRQLATRGIADSNRVGIYGWSYGGYLAAMCLCRAPDVFHVAVAGAPVTSWDGYDTHYTERYMGLPSENPSGYREAAIFDHVPNMRGKLMIVHGLIDENVHFRHTARLINRLIAAGKDYDLLIFPDERHSPRRLRDRIYMEQRISDYFLRNLMGSAGVDGVAASSNELSGPFSRGGGGGSSSSSTMRAMAGHL